MRKVIYILLLGLTFIFNNAIANEEIPLTTDSRIRTIVYNPNEVFQLNKQVQDPPW